MSEAVAAKVKQPKFFVRMVGGGVDWKMPAIAVSLVASILMGVLLVKQWNYASVGRNVTNDVVKFLEYHGSTKKKGVIQGGMLNSPMTVSAATTQIVARVLSIMNRSIEEESQKEEARRTEEEAAAIEAEKNKTKPKLCYDPPKHKPGKPAGSASATPVKHDKVSKEDKKKKKQRAPSLPAAAAPPPASRSESEAEASDVGEQNPNSKRLFEPEDTRAMMRGNPEPEIEPYTPPRPVMPRGGAASV